MLVLVPKTYFQDMFTDWNDLLTSWSVLSVFFFLCERVNAPMVLLTVFWNLNVGGFSEPTFFKLDVLYINYDLKYTKDKYQLHRVIRFRYFRFRHKWSRSAQVCFENFVIKVMNLSITTSKFGKILYYPLMVPFPKVVGHICRCFN